jgi:hypothetical protein
LRKRESVRFSSRLEDGPFIQIAASWPPQVLGPQFDRGKRESHDTVETPWAAKDARIEFRSIVRGRDHDDSVLCRESVQAVQQLLHRNPAGPAELGLAVEGPIEILQDNHRWRAVLGGGEQTLESLAHEVLVA